MSKTSNGNPFRTKAVVSRDRKFRPGPTLSEIEKAPRRMESFESIGIESLGAFVILGSLGLVAVAMGEWLWSLPVLFCACCAVAAAIICRRAYVATREMLREHEAGMRKTEDDDGD